MTDPTKEEALLKYENFINNVLREDLKRVESQLMQINTKTSDLIQQRHTLKVLTDEKIHPEGFKTQVNLGYNFFMEAVVPDTSTMLVNIGLNHYLELTLPEANKHLDALIKAYEKKGDELRTTAAEITAHIKLILINLGALEKVNGKG